MIGAFSLSISSNPRFRIYDHALATKVNAGVARQIDSATMFGVRRPLKSHPGQQQCNLFLQAKTVKEGI
jgi:hypothetical protein